MDDNGDVHPWDNLHGEEDIFPGDNIGFTSDDLHVEDEIFTGDDKDFTSDDLHGDGTGGGIIGECVTGDDRGVLNGELGTAVNTKYNKFLKASLTEIHLTYYIKKPTSIYVSFLSIT